MTQKDADRSYVAPRLMTHRESEGLSVQIKRLTARHYALMDHILAHPTQTQAEWARAFHVTPAWLSTVYHSDLFQTVLNARRGQISENYDNRIQAKMRAIAEAGLDSLATALDDEETPLSARESITKLALTGLGKLGNKSAAPTVIVQQNNTSHMTKEDLDASVQAARQRILARSQQPVIIEQGNPDD